jgi:uncharacterized protein YkwD
MRWRQFLRPAAAILAAALPGFFAPRAAAADDFDALRRDFLDAINAERVKDGVVPLKLSPPLCRLAQELAEEFARRGEPELGEVSEEMIARVNKEGYPVKTLTEVFTQVDGTIPEVIASWPRRDEQTWKTLVRGDSRDLGVGVAILDDTPIYVFFLGLSADDFLAGRGVPRSRRHAAPDARPSERGAPQPRASGALTQFRSRSDRAGLRR